MNNLDFDNMTIDQFTVALDLDEEERELLESIENAEQLGISVSAVVQEVMHKYLRGELIEASNPLNAMFEENARDVARIGGS